MEHLRFAGFLLLGALCLVMGGFALADGDLAALAGLGFGVVCVAGAFMTREPTEPEEPIERGSVTSHGRTFTGLVITFSRRRAALAVAMGVGFVATGAWMIAEKSLVGGILVTATFVVMTVLGVIALVRGTGKLILTDDEIAHVAAGGRASVRFEDVTDVERFSIRGAPFLRVDSVGGADLAGGGVLLAAQLTRRSSFDLPLSAVGVDPDWLEAQIRERVATAASAAPDASPAASA